MTAAAVKPGGRAWGLGCGRLEPRHHVIVAMFLATFTAYVERVGFSIAFTSMAKQSKLDESVKGTVLSAFYWGYGLSQVRRCGRSAPDLRPCGGSAMRACRGRRAAWPARWAFQIRSYHVHHAAAPF